MLNHPIVVTLVILLLWAVSITAIVLIPYAPLGVYFFSALVFCLKGYVKMQDFVPRVFYSAKPNPKFLNVFAQFAGKTVGFLTLFLTPLSLMAAFDKLFG